MKILLDTHIFLWWIKGESRLSKIARNFILDAQAICEPLQLLTFDKILGDYHDLVKIIV